MFPQIRSLRYIYYERSDESNYAQRWTQLSEYLAAMAEMREDGRTMEKDALALAQSQVGGTWYVVSSVK